MNFESLKLSCKGQLVLPDNPQYDEARKVYNAMIDKHPAAILFCQDEEDVKHGILFAKENKLDLAIRGGGHNGAGLGTCDAGLVLDMSPMKQIEIDSDNKTAKVQAGCTLGEVDKATHEHGLMVPGGIISTTGIAGLTLGGGIGYFTRKLGLTIDNLLGARVVLANGQIVNCNAIQHPDLFWAIRGGGGNFGVVVQFAFKLSPISIVHAGPMFWELEDAKEVMKFFDRFTKEADIDLYGFFAFLVVPPGDPFPKHLHNKKVCGIVWNYTGPAQRVEEVYQPIRDFKKPIFDLIMEIPVPGLNSLFDDLYPAGYQWYWKAHYINELTDACIDTNISFGETLPSLHSTTHFYPIDGKVHQMASDETAWVNRDNRWVQVIVGVDPEPVNKEKVTNWCRSYYDAMIPFAIKGAYVNFMMKEGEERIRSSYRENYDKLVGIKTKYDPDNIFHINQNIKPS
ncbi:MAG: FAD-binding oxidoreductase [Bacteroidales bacterium]|nr:FAD-binding oxidoreductase [Bacteroidales bacterium]